MNGLWCRLRFSDPGGEYLVKLPSATGYLAYPRAIFEIHNDNPEPAVIPYQHSVLQYLDIVVSDPAGSCLSRGTYGNQFCRIPTPPGRELVLLGGESFSAVVVLLATADRSRLVPGRYQTSARYRFGR